jgi:hypothetical protein
VCSRIPSSKHLHPRCPLQDDHNPRYVPTRLLAQSTLGPCFQNSREFMHQEPFQRGRCRTAPCSLRMKHCCSHLSNRCNTGIMGSSTRYGPSLSSSMHACLHSACSIVGLYQRSIGTSSVLLSLVLMVSAHRKEVYQPCFWHFGPLFAPILRPKNVSYSLSLASRALAIFAGRFNLPLAK